MLAALMLIGGTGCGSNSPKLSAEQSKAFDSAPAEAKQAWDKALAADKANDYMNAQKSLDSLNQMILSDPQRKALETESSSFEVRLMQAVDKNDPAAVKAIQEINQTRSRRK